MAETDRYVQFGPRTVKFPSPELQQLNDCNHIINDAKALREELQTKGYLFIRGLHDRQKVLNARNAVLEYIDKTSEFKLVQPLSSGVLDARCGKGCIPFMEGKNDITHSEKVMEVIEGPNPRDFFKKILGKEARTFDFKWLRGINRKQFTGAHVDNVYMGRGTTNLYTMWTPIGDTTVEMGTLAVCESSNCLPSFTKFQSLYGDLDLEKENVQGSGWFTTDPQEISSKFGGEWKTSDFKAGDVLIFTMRTVHMSTSNLTDLVRISCDTRWQPFDEPVDPRYVGDIPQTKPKYGLYSKENQGPNITVEDLKQKWGL